MNNNNNNELINLLTNLLITQHYWNGIFWTRVTWSAI